MNLEMLIYQTLTADVSLSPLLASFSSSPAVFEMLAPSDDAPGWGGRQTPRIEYVVNREEDPERRVSGQVSISIIHEDTSNEMAAAIETNVRRLLDGATFRPDGETITLQWHTVELFDDEPDYRGVELLFDLIAWPTGLSYAPDPVQALRDWSAARWLDLQVDPQTWAPTDTTPALYWRFAEVQTTEMQSWGAWITGRFRGHLLAKTPNTRIAWLRRLAEGVSIDRHAQISDGSRLFFESVSAAGDADPLRAGQITLVARFGVMNLPTGTPLNNVFVN